MSRALSTFALLILNAGWIIPFYLAIRSLIDWCELEASPLVYGTERTVNSFPFLAFSERMFTVTCIWLAIVIAGNTLVARFRRTATREVFES
jgi:hypothetical protein